MQIESFCIKLLRMWCFFIPLLLLLLLPLLLYYYCSYFCSYYFFAVVFVVWCLFAHTILPHLSILSEKTSLAPQSKRLFQSKSVMATVNIFRYCTLYVFVFTIYVHKLRIESGEIHVLQTIESRKLSTLRTLFRQFSIEKFALIKNMQIARMLFANKSLFSCKSFWQCEHENSTQKLFKSTKLNEEIEKEQKRMGGTDKEQRD